MRKKIEEQLVKLAFGDLEAEDARLLELRTQGDPEASRTLDTYCRMKEELRSLHQDVPADQLSKERLREAILTRGLERKPEAPSRPTWLWMPAAAAALAFGVMFVKGQIPGNDGRGPMVVNMSEKPLIDLPELKVDKDAILDRKASIVTPKKIVSDKPATTVASNYDPSRLSRNGGRYSNAGRGREELDVALPEGASALTFRNLPAPSEELMEKVDFGPDPARIRSAITAPVTPAPGGLGDAQPTIVIIQPEKDSDTGTFKAKEIESTTNVVVGG